MKQSILLTKLELLNFFGWNEYKHAKNPADKKRRLFLLAAYALILAACLIYSGVTAYSFVQFGAAERIPLIFPLLAPLLMLGLGIFRAKSMLYREKDLDLLASLPIKSSSIVASRTLRMYVENFLLGLIILLPAVTIYSIFTAPTISFYCSILLVFLFLPLLPTAISAWVGILMSAIIARNKHKVLTEVLLSVIFVVGFLLLSPLTMSKEWNSIVDQGSEYTQSGKLGDLTNEEINALLAAKTAEAFEALETSYPFLRNVSDILSGKNLPGLLLFCLAFMLLFLLTVILIGKNFFAISQRLYTTSAGHDYKLSSLKKNSMMGALIQKEMLRYFSSGIYVSNTIIGPVLAVAFAISLGFFELSDLLNGAENLPITIHLQSGIPFFLGMIFCIMSVSCSSISIEGKNWWLAKSLPIAAKELLQAKLLFNLLLLTPFYLLAQVILLFTVRANLVGRLLLLICPAVLIVFSVVFGLFINLCFPKFQWESDMEVVKQSAAGGISMLGMFVAIIPAFSLSVLPEDLVPLVSLIFTAVILAVTYLLYRRIMKSTLPE